MGKIIHIVKTKLGILALFILFVHFFLVWHYAAPAWSRIKALDPVAKGYVHPLFIQNFQLFAPVPTTDYHTAWRSVSPDTSVWRSSEDAIDAAHDQWKITADYQANIGHHNMLFWIHYDYANNDMPDFIDTAYAREQNMLRTNLWRMSTTYLRYRVHQNNAPEGMYQLRCIFDNIKSTQADTIIIQSPVD